MRNASGPSTIPGRSGLLQPGYPEEGDPPRPDTQLLLLILLDVIASADYLVRVNLNIVKIPA